VEIARAAQAEVADIEMRTREMSRIGNLSDMEHQPFGGGRLD